MWRAERVLRASGLVLIREDELEAMGIGPWVLAGLALRGVVRPYCLAHDLVPVYQVLRPGRTLRSVLAWPMLAIIAFFALGSS